MTQILEGIAPLPQWGVLRAQGEDAASFLHGQLTHDFALLGSDQARLAAFCSAKGRMQASFIAFKRAPDDILLLCSRDLLAPTLKRLSMFVLRAKCKMSDASADFQVLGLAGSAVLGGMQAPWTLQAAEGDAHIVHLYPAAGSARALWVAPAQAAIPQGAALDEATWRWGEIASGIATVSQPVFEAFVPQMLNYESVGGVNFKKGCYPGQEVVARSQFRGTLKRRAYIVHSDAELTAGTEVFAADDAEQATGTVVQAAPRPDGGWAAIVSMQVSSANEALTASSANGPALQVQPLPYALLEDI